MGAYKAWLAHLSLCYKSRTIMLGPYPGQHFLLLSITQEVWSGATGKGAGSDITAVWGEDKATLCT